MWKSVKRYVRSGEYGGEVLGECGGVRKGVG